MLHTHTHPTGIRCTICSTSPENHKKQERPHLKGVRLPATSFMVTCRFKSLSCSEKTRFLVVRTGFTLAEMHSVRFTGTAGAAGQHKKHNNRKANCFALLKRITNLKMSIPMSSSSTVTRKGVASSGSMASCRSHHGYYTRQKWIFEEIRRELRPLNMHLD